MLVVLRIFQNLYYKCPKPTKNFLKLLNASIKFWKSQKPLQSTSVLNLPTKNWSTMFFNNNVLHNKTQNMVILQDISKKLKKSQKISSFFLSSFLSKHKIQSQKLGIFSSFPLLFSLHQLHYCTEIPNGLDRFQGMIAMQAGRLHLFIIFLIIKRNTVFRYLLPSYWRTQQPVNWKWL